MTGQTAAFDVAPHDPAHVGVTATRDGLTREQRTAAVNLLAGLHARGATTLHEGDCVGGDDELVSISRAVGFFVVAHPGPGRSYRAFAYCDESRPVCPFDVRNQQIVDQSGTLIGFPPTEPDHEIQQSGTWQTIRMGRRAGIRVIVVGPSGAVTDSAGVLS